MPGTQLRAPSPAAPTEPCRAAGWRRCARRICWISSAIRRLVSGVWRRLPIISWHTGRSLSPACHTASQPSASVATTASTASRMLPVPTKRSTMLTCAVCIPGRPALSALQPCSEHGLADCGHLQLCPQSQSTKQQLAGTPRPLPMLPAALLVLSVMCTARLLGLSNAPQVLHRVRTTEEA